MEATNDLRTRGRGEAGTPPPGRQPPPWLAELAARHPYLRRHPHPAVAHFPIVFMLAASFFSVLYLLTGVESFETTAFHCLGGGVLTTPAAIITGLLTQRLNYPQPDATLALEKRLSFLLWAMGACALVWRWLDPQVLRHLQGLNLFYFLLVLALTPLVTIISYFGGMLTFPLEPEGSSERTAVPGRFQQARPEAGPTDISS